jgi:hypothetical protein
VSGEIPARACVDELESKHKLTARQVGEAELGTSLHKAQGENARLLGTRGAPVYEMHGGGLRKYLSILGHQPGTEFSLLRATELTTTAPMSPQVQCYPSNHRRAIQDGSRLWQVCQASAPAGRTGSRARRRGYW